MNVGDVLVFVLGALGFGVLVAAVVFFLAAYVFDDDSHRDWHD